MYVDMYEYVFCFNGLNIPKFDSIESISAQSHFVAFVLPGGLDGKRPRTK